MKWGADSESLKTRHYEIKHDPLVGYYLYAFEGDRCVRDHLQDTLEIAIESAFEDFEVPKDAWRKVESAENQGAEKWVAPVLRVLALPPASLG